MKTFVFGAALVLSIATFSGIDRAQAAEDQAAARQCQDKLKAAKQGGLLYDIKLQPGKAVMVVDGPAWSTIPFGTKTAFVQALVCYLTVGDKSKSAKIEVHDNVNDHVVGEYDGRTLKVP